MFGFAGLSANARGTEVLKGVSLSIPPGSITALVGGQTRTSLPCLRSGYFTFASLHSRRDGSQHAECESAVVQAPARASRR